MKHIGRGVNQMKTVNMNMKSLALTEKMEEAKTKLDTAIITGMLLLANTGFAFATDMWSQGETAAKDVYKKVVSISTPIAAASLVILWIFRMCTHNQQNIDKSRSVSKMLIITWILINALGYALVYAKSAIGTGGEVDFGMIMPYFNC